MADILIVDDSKFMRKTIADILTEAGHQIVGEAENAKEGTELYRILKPDLVTLDIVMPEIEEVDAISALREMIEVDPQARVVMVSAMGQEEVVQECIQAGARDFVIKPFQPAYVAGVVNDVLNG
jgi:two-component system, chemotaxis family, chemotaxis protein CheY